MDANLIIDITKDDLSRFLGGTTAFVTFGEVMVRDTPADMEQPEQADWCGSPWPGANTRLPLPSVDWAFPDFYHPCTR